ncbi:MAG: hypothetical protein KBA61_00120 [Spirochaetes bacterium]|nr:hypothetical protein [Spirochaetota bacterium]
MLIKKAKANLDIARYCAGCSDVSYYSVGASRAYYSIFQSAKSILQNGSFDYFSFLNTIPKRKEYDHDNHKPYSHGTISSALCTYISKRPKYIEETHKYLQFQINATFSALYSLRVQADYEGKDIEISILNDAIKKAEKLISDLKLFIGFN